MKYNIYSLYHNNNFVKKFIAFNFKDANKEARLMELDYKLKKHSIKCMLYKTVNY